MRYTLNSAELLDQLQILDKVVPTKNVTPIELCVLFDIKDDTLYLRSTDREITLTSSMPIADSSGDCRFAIESKRMIEILRTMPEQPVTLDVDTVSLQINIDFQNGHLVIQGESADDFPALKNIEGEISSFPVNSKALSRALGNAMAATATEKARLVMQGVFFDITPDEFAVVASDGRKLSRTLIKSESQNNLTTSFVILPKPISIICSMIDKADGVVNVSSNTEGNASFSIGTFTMYCRLLSDPYPNYRKVIPQNNDNTAIIDRLSILSALKRAIAIADKATCLVKLQFGNDKITLSAENNNYAQSAEEQIVCQYDGVNLKVGFQGDFLYELINRINSNEVVIKLSDPSRAGLILPSEQEENTELLMLLMPLLITN